VAHAKHDFVPMTPRALCPVCKKAVYSPAGIHPQCAMWQSDPGRLTGKRPKPAALAATAPVADAIPSDPA